MKAHPSELAGRLLQEMQNGVGVMYIWGGPVFRPGDSWVTITDATFTPELLTLKLQGPYDRGPSVLEILKPGRVKLEKGSLQAGEAALVRWDDQEYPPQPAELALWMQ